MATPSPTAADIDRLRTHKLKTEALRDAARIRLSRAQKEYKAADKTFKAAQLAYVEAIEAAHGVTTWMR